LTAKLTANDHAPLSAASIRDVNEDDPNVFQELGEALFWMCAYAEAGRGYRTDRLIGLNWARNRVAHGLIVTTPVNWMWGTELGRWQLGKGVLGATSGHKWLARSDNGLLRAAHPSPRQDRAYDAELAGRYVGESLVAGVADLSP
jgi:hypothetical protein